MTEEAQEQPQQTPTEDPIAKLRDEFQSQFNTLKTTFEEENKKNLETISSLKKENEDLHRALIRSAQLPPVPEVPQKTEEQIYQEQITEYAKKSIAYEKMNRGIS